MTILNYSDYPSYQISQLCESMVIRKALAGDRFNWNNDAEGEEK